MHAFLGRVALMENDGNRDKHPCLSDRMEVEISDVFSLKKSHRQSSNILVSCNLNRKQNQPMPVALTMNGCFTRAKINPEPELRAISAKIAKYCKVYATEIISTNTEPKKKTSYIKPTKNNRLQGSIRIFLHIFCSSMPTLHTRLAISPVKMLRHESNLMPSTFSSTKHLAKVQGRPGQ